MAEETKKKSVAKQRKMMLWLIAIAVIVIIILVVFRNKEAASDKFSINNSIQVSGLELINNKEKYENVEVKIMDVLVPDPLFAYIDKPEGGGERLFIDPKKSDYCLHFNLLGKLQRDEKRVWLFHVKNFECVSKN
ncbi:hypothetical protein HY212_02850 [Candidatus Pacearchaeota archaeon]|nr:hypothetical protein [Candidatus Pacearchaeota archaeon]